MMNKPKMTRAEVLRYAIGEIPADEKVFVIAIRGYYLDTMGKPGVNDRGIYDDAFFLITPDGFYPFNANTDPSIFRPGIASLVPGKYYFKKGKHGISRPGGGYPAFRPATPDESLPVSRDGQKTITKGIAINIHKGGYNTTSSEGCQTVYPDQWADFQARAYAEMDKYGQKLLPYHLAEYKK